MLEAAPPSAACSSLTWRKPRPSWEARAARGGGRGRTRAGPRATGRRGGGQTAPPPEPPNRFAPFARRTLPPAGEGARGREGRPPGSGRVRAASLPLPLPAFLRAVCSPPPPGEAWNPGAQLGRRGGRGTGSASSLAGTIPCATPWLASPKQHRLSSGASDAKGREERERRRTGSGCCGGSSQGWSG